MHPATTSSPDPLLDGPIVDDDDAGPDHDDHRDHADEADHPVDHADDVDDAG